MRNPKSEIRNPKSETTAAGEPGLSRRVRVVPNRNCIGLAVLVLAMWYAAASQSNGAAYLLCFTVIGVTIVSGMHAWANLRGIEVSSGPIRPVFAGEEMRIPLVVRGASARGHAGIGARIHDGPLTAIAELPPGEPQRIEIVVKAVGRGCFTDLWVELVSLFPLGFFTASRQLTVLAPHWIYPKPTGSLPLPRSPAGGDLRNGRRVEGDDFAGVRAYRRGESQRHIDWKAVARGQPMLVKQWAGQADETVHIDWRQLDGLETEPRLSQLTRWVILAERSGATYSLWLPRIAIAAASGEAHMHQCLRALAAFSI
jgi:protein-glutamine gamma-glutamyltransferase